MELRHYLNGMDIKQNWINIIDELCLEIKSCINAIENEMFDLAGKLDTLIRIQ